MTELLHAAVSPPNLLPTALLVFVLLYWLTVIVGLLDFKTLDISTSHDFDGTHSAHISAYHSRVYLPAAPEEFVIVSGLDVLAEPDAEHESSRRNKSKALASGPLVKSAGRRW